MSDEHRDRIMNAIGKFYAKSDKNKKGLQEAWKESGPKRKRRAPSDVPLEREEQVRLAKYLDGLGLLWCHVPNEGHGGYGKGAQIKGAQLRSQGLRKGVPDALVFNKCTITEDGETLSYSGCAIELKRQKGGRVSDEQKAWIRDLRAAGWRAEVCHGFEEAKELIERLGYGKENDEQRCEKTSALHEEGGQESE
jgi:hypothetical protein